MFRLDIRKAFRAQTILITGSNILALSLSKRHSLTLA